jgi:uncharacterized protein
VPRKAGPGDRRSGSRIQELRRQMKHPGRFDAFGVAAHQGVVAGRSDAVELPRVTDLLAPEAGAAEIEYRIVGAADGAGRPALKVTLAGSVPLTCQRCLQPFQWPVEQTTLLLLARDEAELARLDGEDHEHEVVLADAPLDPLTLVEDELLLTLPFVPRCPEATCPALRGVAAAPEQQVQSAFGALAELRGAPGRKSPR